MNKVILVIMSVVLLSACSGMNVKPTVGVSMGAAI